MLGLPEIFAIVKAVISFPETVLAFVRLLEATPQELHEKVLRRIADEAKRFEDTGRPS